MVFPDQNRVEGFLFDIYSRLPLAREDGEFLPERVFMSPDFPKLPPDGESILKFDYAVGLFRAISDSDSIKYPRGMEQDQCVANRCLALYSAILWCVDGYDRKLDTEIENFLVELGAKPLNDRKITKLRILLHRISNHQKK